jgi:hypothetical protein
MYSISSSYESNETPALHEPQMEITDFHQMKGTNHVRKYRSDLENIYIWCVLNRKYAKKYCNFLQIEEVCNETSFAPTYPYL